MRDPTRRLFHEGSFNSDALGEGTFTLRFTPQKDALIFTWIPDSAEEEVQRIQIPLISGDPTMDANTYATCVSQYNPQEGTPPGEVVRGGLLTVLGCLREAVG